MALSRKCKRVCTPLKREPRVEVCANSLFVKANRRINQPNGDPVRVHNDANCLGWVEGFGDGFTVHDELLGVSERDKMVCMPWGIRTVQMVRVIKKYLADNPDKAHRATRYVASLALARAFPCKAGK
jgi:hypothetical protein